MGSIDVSNGTSHLHGSYVAVPAGLDLEGLLSNIDGLNGNIFDYDHTPPHVDGHKVLVEQNDGFVDLTVTYSRRPFFDPRLYNLPDDLELEGRTTLHVSALGPSESSTQTVVHQIMEQFPGAIDLEFRHEFLSQLQNAGVGMLTQFSYTTPFFDRYLELRRMLEDVRSLDTKQLLSGSLIGLARDLISRMGGNYSPEQHHFRLVRSVEGTYNGQNVELSFLYFTSAVQQGVYGVILTSKAEEKCEQCVEQFCDMSRSNVGYILRPDLMVIGGTIILARENRHLMARLGFTPDNKIPTHINGYEVMNSDLPLDVVERKADELKSSTHFSPIQTEEIKSLARILYAAKGPKM